MVKEKKVKRVLTDEQKKARKARRLARRAKASKK